jgi:hypothetical protein
MFREAHDMPRALADKVRADEAYRSALEASRTANAAGRDLLGTLLAQAKDELDSFEISRSVSAE